MPFAFTCFNLSDIFSQENFTGLQWGQGVDRLNDSTLERGVNYTLDNLDTYDAGANYSQVWFQQVNLTSEEVGEGESAGRFFKVYSLPDCATLSTANGGDDPVEWNPWYEQSCQSASGGNCHLVPHNIQSFSIQQDTSDSYGQGCQDWVFPGSASQSSRRSSLVVGGVAILVALWGAL